MTRSDPYDPDGKNFECPSCGHRGAAGSITPSCPNCGTTMRNISVPRE